MEKETIQSSGVMERLQQLSVERPASYRSETPPPRHPLQQTTLSTSSPSIVYMSPSHKDNSSPTTTTIKQARPFDLTPVMRNTSADFVDEDLHNTISPEETMEKMGLDFMSQEKVEFSARPNLQKRGFPVLHSNPICIRSRSLVMLNEGVVNIDDDESEELLGEAIELPPRQHFYSFNSRSNYENQTNSATKAIASSTPYQPYRQHLSDVRALSSEEVSRIFMLKDMNSIPLEERQFSIPSIRMANHLNGSTTTYDDEEDDLSRDDASWSSRGSSLFLPDDKEIAEVQLLRFTPTASRPCIVLEDLPIPEILIPKEGGTVPAVKCSPKKKRKESHLKVYDWLRSVESEGADLIQEAASSKFLTQQDKRKIFSRQLSSPPGTV
jgi:hypothetical protein